MPNPQTQARLKRRGKGERWRCGGASDSGEGKGGPQVLPPLQEDAVERSGKQARQGGVRGQLDSPAPRHHQLHFHFVGNDDAQDLTVGTFPQPAGKTGKLVRRSLADGIWFICGGQWKGPLSFPLLSHWSQESCAQWTRTCSLEFCIGHSLWY